MFYLSIMISLLILLLINNIDIVYGVSTPIYIGLLLNNFDVNHQQDIGGQQLLQSFLIALEEVDHFSNQYGDYHFEFILSNAHGHFDSAKETLALVQSGIRSVISALPNTEALTTLVNY